MSLTALQKANYSGFPKPGELIEISGTHGLEASDRAILNLLYEHAHTSGLFTQPVGGEWEIPLARLRPSKHESNDRLRGSLDRLMRVIASVPYIDGAGASRVLKTHLFDFFDVPGDNAQSILRFGLPKKLLPVLARSNRWGRIKAEVVCAMSSRYAIALYELVQLRASMDRCIETMPIARFRDLLGVPPGAYSRGNNFQQKVLCPAVLEVNGLSDMGVAIEVKRRGPRSPIDAVVLSWWRQTGDEFRAVVQERDKSKVGRAARLRGEVETVTPMRQTDLEEFLKGA